MSQISTVYDSFITKIEATLTSYTRLANPYFIERNDNLRLAKGYAVGYGEGTTLDWEFGNKHQYFQRNFDVTLTKQIETHRDNEDGREAADQALLEDWYLLAKALELDHTLSGVAVGCLYKTDTGILPIDFNGTESFIQVKATFEVQYREVLA